jgi:hypothetical protein
MQKRAKKFPTPETEYLFLERRVSGTPKRWLPSLTPREYAKRGFYHHVSEKMSK